MRFTGKVVIVTGATKGIGEATAKAFAKEGAKVVAAGRSIELGERVVGEIKAEGGEAIFVRCDVSNPDDVNNLVKQTVEAFGTIDVAVNNAGVNHSAEFFDISPDDWDWVLGVDLKGTFLVTQAAARVMVEQGKKSGFIVNVTSVMGDQLALADQVPYCAAKGGANQFTKAAALALIPYGIRVNGVAPGPVLTELMQRVVHSKEKSDKLMERLPIGYVASTEEIARVIMFMGSEDASYFVGETVLVDGGRGIQAFPRALEKATGVAG